MRKAALKWALIAAAGSIAGGTHAATYDFNFSTTDSVFAVSATISTADTLNSVGGYDILSISGTIYGAGGGTIALEPNPLQPLPYANAGVWYDNVYFSGAAPVVDDYGILFTAGGYDYNLYAAGPTAYYLSSDNPAGNYNPGSAVVFGEAVRTDAVSGVPEPSTWALTLLGFGGLALAARRRSPRIDLTLSPQLIPAVRKT